jgi:hydrogenase maturation protein HypF
MRLIERRTNCPDTSSVGRLFDGVAALAGLRDQVSYEGQAAMELEWLASELPAAGVSPFDFEIVAQNEPGSPLLIDTRPIFIGVAADLGRGCPAALIARRFHTTLVAIVAEVCRRLRQAEGLEAVVLSGGVFQNALLTTEVVASLERDGFRAYRHRLVPPGDGGLCLGQLALAAAASSTFSPFNKM